MIIFHKNNSGDAFVSATKFTTGTDGLEQTTQLGFSLQGMGYPYYLCILEHAPI